MEHAEILRVFNSTFLQRFNTRMYAGAPEPLYIPAQGEHPAQLWFREDFAASALHEAAHWCIAGAARRRLPDFGYNYLPPPRDGVMQQAFFRLELRAQTLESLFAVQAGVPFTVSADNLDADCHAFGAEVAACQPDMCAWMHSSRDERARQFYLALGKARKSACCAEDRARCDDSPHVDGQSDVVPSDDGPSDDKKGRCRG